MGLFFGTDGLRGEFMRDISPEIAYKCGNSLAKTLGNAGKILIATDTRKSGDVLALSFASGVMIAGAFVVFVGVCPTAGVSYLAKEKGFDYGVVISASHNPAEFNGIKIFDKNGKKISDETEREIEKGLLILQTKQHYDVGCFSCDESLVFEYVNFLKNTAKNELENGKDFAGLKIVIDSANGASSKIAGKIFSELGATVIQIADQPNGTNINRGVGAVHISNLQKHVLQHHADIGFAYDGDSDRVVAVSRDGKIVDGDQFVYIFARDYLEKSKLKNLKVVGTVLTNFGIEKALNEIKIEHLRADVGDRFVSKMLEENELLIGGEPAGHVFVCDKLQTGDGILNSLLLTCLCVNKNKRIDDLVCQTVYCQKNSNIKVKNKNAIIKNEELLKEISNKNLEMNSCGRLVVRASGTEPVIRIMVESEDEKLADYALESLEKLIKKIDTRGDLCVE